MTWPRSRFLPRQIYLTSSIPAFGADVAAAIGVFPERLNRSTHAAEEASAVLAAYA
jgi:hypothetical protein